MIDDLEEKVLTREIAEQWVADENSGNLDNFTRINDNATKALSDHEGYLSLVGLTNLGDEVAEILSTHKGDLGLYSISTLSKKAAAALAARQELYAMKRQQTG